METTENELEQAPFPLKALSDDLLIAVFESLVEMSPYSLDACTAVCHRFYRLAIPIKYRDVHVCNDRSHRLTKRLALKGSQLPLFVRRATLDDRYVYGHGDAEPLHEVVRATKKLKEIVVYGSYQFSQPLLDTINSLFPSIKIEYHAEYPREEDGWYQGWDKGPLEGGMNGFCSPQLHSLRIDGMWTVDSDGPLVVRRSLEKIVKNCPNLRHFTTYDSDVTHSLHLHLSRSDRLPSLESFAYIPLSFEDIQTWGEATGWQSLTDLKVTPVNVVPIFAACGIPQLQSLTISGSQMADAYDKLPELRAPLRFLSIKVSEDRLPLQFLAQFEDTLEELMICRERGTSDRGYSATDMRLLNETCPLLRKLYVRPYVDETVLVWPQDFLEELSHYQMLECLVLGQENQSKLQPSSDLCLESYNSVRGNNPSSKLRQLGLVHEYDSSRCDDFSQLLSDTKALCIGVADGEGASITKKQGYYYDYGIKSKCEREAHARALLHRPFSKKLDHIWGDRSEADVIWTVKQLGPGSDWAVKELLPQGLIRQEHIDDDRTPGNLNYREAIEDLVKDEEGLEEYRRLMKEELKHWKGVWERRDKYGRHYSLYDVLYPRKDLT